VKRSDVKVIGNCTCIRHKNVKQQLVLFKKIKELMIENKIVKLDFCLVPTNLNFEDDASFL